jgi:hypothetical protein
MANTEPIIGANQYQRINTHYWRQQPPTEQISNDWRQSLAEN